MGWPADGWWWWWERALKNEGCEDSLVTAGQKKKSYLCMPAHSYTFNSAVVSGELMGDRLGGHGSGQNPRNERKCLFWQLIHCMVCITQLIPAPRTRHHVFRAPREGVVMVNDDVEGWWWT